MYVCIHEGFSGGTSGKEPACQCRRLKRCRLDPWVRKIPWRRAWQPTPVFLPGESHGQRSLAGYSPWGHRVGHNWSDHMHTCIHVYIYTCEFACRLHSPIKRLLFLSANRKAKQLTSKGGGKISYFRGFFSYFVLSDFSIPSIKLSHIVKISMVSLKLFRPVIKTHLHFHDRKLRIRQFAWPQVTKPRRSEAKAETRLLKHTPSTLRLLRNYV